MPKSANSCKCVLGILNCNLLWRILHTALPCHLCRVSGRQMAERLLSWKMYSDKSHIGRNTDFSKTAVLFGKFCSTSLPLQDHHFSRLLTYR